MTTAMRSSCAISIHALREEGDSFGNGKQEVPEYFYPRPPRGGRREGGRMSCLSCEFLSTPSARRATRWSAAQRPRRSISIHALREEGDEVINKGAIETG